MAPVDPNEWVRRSKYDKDIENVNKRFDTAVETLVECLATAEAVDYGEAARNLGINRRALNQRVCRFRKRAADLKNARLSTAAGSGQTNAAEAGEEAEEEDEVVVVEEEDAEDASAPGTGPGEADAPAAQEQVQVNEEDEIPVDPVLLNWGAGDK